jgi:uroporphyrinogen decarboxylase
LAASLLSSRERVCLALEHRETDRIPFAMVCSGINEPAAKAFEQYLAAQGRGSLATCLAPLVDIRAVGPQYFGPALAPDTDIWGVRRRAVCYGLGSYQEIEHYPLAAAQSLDAIDAHHWPDPAWFDYTVLPDRIAAAHIDGEHAIMVANGNLFETSWYMRGFETMMVDMVLHPEWVHAVMARVTDFYVAYFQRLLAAAPGQVDLVFTADDIGGQQGLLMSLPMWEEFIKPYHVRLNAVIHGLGARIMYHSDGAVMAAVPGLIDMGIDVLQALQFDAAGMDAVRLKETYGHDLCFQGGVSVQQTLPFGTPDQVRAETAHLIATLGRQGGYILGPSHCIQAGTPPANIAAMVDTVRDYYPYR